MTAESQETAQQLFFISVECNGPDEAGIVPVAEEVFKAVQASAEANGNRPVIDKFEEDGLGNPPFQVLRIEAA